MKKYGGQEQAYLKRQRDKNKKTEKLTFIKFNEKLVKWYDETRPASGKPRIGLRSRFYDMYLKGQDFKFL